MSTTHRIFRARRREVVLAGVVTFMGLLGSPRAARADLVESCARAAEASQELRAADRLVESREQLRSCARDVCPGVVQADCRTWLAEVEGAVPSVVIFASDDQDRPLSAVTVSIDGRIVAKGLDGKPIAVDPGNHTFSFEAEGFHAATQDMVVRTAEKNRDLRVVLRPIGGAEPGATDASAGIPTWSWVLFGVGVAALGTGTYLGLDARSDVSHLRETCAPFCATDDVDRSRRQLLIADIALGVGMVSVGAATWLALSGSKEEPAPVTVSVGPGSVSAQWGTRF